MFKEIWASIGMKYSYQVIDLSSQRQLLAVVFSLGGGAASYRVNWSCKSEELHEISIGKSKIYLLWRFNSWIFATVDRNWWSPRDISAILQHYSQYNSWFETYNLLEWPRIF